MTKEVAFGIQHSNLSGEILIGRVNQAGIRFAAHEYHTQAAVWAVAEYVEKTMGGSMFITLKGKRYDITVTSEEIS